MVLLFNSYLFGYWPEHVTSPLICPSGISLVVALLPAAHRAVVVLSNWVEAMGVTIASHVPELCHLGAPAVSIGVSVGVAIFIVGFDKSIGDWRADSQFCG
jgi:hypothetical protein